MSDIVEKVIEARVAVAKKTIIFTAEDVSNGDTITLDDLTTIDGAEVLNRATGARITQSVATNVITIGGSYTNVDVIGIAIGDTA